MIRDASFLDGGEQPLRLLARTPEDLQAISALCQDAVLTPSDLKYEPNAGRFSLLLKRFRWEDPMGRTERVQSLLSFQAVRRVQANFDKSTPPALSLLSCTFEADKDALCGTLTLLFAEGLALRLQVECLDGLLKDVSKPYETRSKPLHAD